MFQNLVAIEPVMLNSETRSQLASVAHRVAFYDDMPQDKTEILRRISGADAVLVNYSTYIGADVLQKARELKYIGMCCSLYSPESANVDIRAAEALRICVKGVRDYGDEGVPEYVISELVRFLHGFGPRMWREMPVELTGLPVGIVGMGTTGQYVARALRFFGAEVYYYSRTRKPGLEEEHGYRYLPLDGLLQTADILVTCLNRGTVLLGEEELRLFDGGKILVNISIGPGHDVKALEGWLDRGNFAFSDTAAGIDPTGRLIKHKNVTCHSYSAGRSAQAAQRLGDKVLQNIHSFFAQQA